MNAKVAMVIRIIFGLTMVIFGLNKFLRFIPTPPLEGTAGELVNIYVTSGFMKLIGGLEVLGGLSLLVNKFVPLSLTILIAIMFNAVVFHTLHAPGGLMNAAVALILGLLLVYHNKSRFSSLLSR